MNIISLRVPYFLHLPSHYCARLQNWEAELVSAQNQSQGQSQSYPECSQSSVAQAEACQADICSYDKHSARDKNSYNNSV